MLILNPREKLKKCCPQKSYKVISFMIMSKYGETANFLHFMLSMFLYKLFSIVKFCVN
jgi:hypothetical protein